MSDVPVSPILLACLMAMWGRGLIRDGRFVHPSGVRKRLGRALSNELWNDIESGRVDEEELNSALARVAFLAEWKASGKDFRKTLERHREAQATLRRFRLVAREMLEFVHESKGPGTLEARWMKGLLDSAELHFGRSAHPSPLIEKPGGKLLDLPANLAERRPRHRPPEAWRKTACAVLHKVGVRTKLAAQIVAELARQSKSQAL